jgi:hypothetical protein
MKVEESKNAVLTLTANEAGELLELLKYASHAKKRKIREFARRLGLELIEACNPQIEVPERKED